MVFLVENFIPIKAFYFFKKVEKSKTKIFDRVMKTTLMHEKCPYSEFFWPLFSCVWSEYEDLLCKYPYSVCSSYAVSICTPCMNGQNEGIYWPLL